VSIATKTGDAGQTALTGGTRVSKADLRVEAYGTVDELNAHLGFARSLCSDEDLRTRTEAIQRTLFRVGSALSRPATDTRTPSALKPEDVDDLTTQVNEIESIEGILSDWSLPGAHRESAAYEIARTVCRRAERCAVRLHEALQPSGETVQPEAIAYLNRLSDLLWLYGRRIEHQAGIDARLRDDAKQGPNWSRAW
jgi:cob(I)alamin adenosyltransferase